MEATDFLRTTVAAVAISVAFFGSNETADARPYRHVFSCYDFAWQSQDLKDCLARHEDAAQRPDTAAKASDPLRVAASARVPWKRAVAPTPYNHIFSCYDFAWQSQEMKDCLAGLPLPTERPVVAAKSAAATVATAAKARPAVGHPAASLAKSARQHHAAPQIAQSHPRPDRPVAAAPTQTPAKTAAASLKVEKPAPRQLALPLPPVTKAPAKAAASMPHPAVVAKSAVPKEPHPAMPAKLATAKPAVAKAAPHPAVVAKEAMPKEARHEAAAQAKPLPPHAPPAELATTKPVAPKAEKAAQHPAVAAKETAPTAPAHAATAQAKPHHVPPAELTTAKPAAPPPATVAKTKPPKEETVQAKPLVPHAPPADLVTAKAAAQKAEKRAPRPALAAKAAPIEPRHEAAAAAKPQPHNAAPASLAATKPPVPTRAASAKPEPHHPSTSKPVEAAAKKLPAAPASPEAPVTAAPRTPVFASPMPPSGSPALPQILRGQAPQDTASVPKSHDAGGSPDTISPAAGTTQILRPGEIEQGPSGHVTIEKTHDGVEVIRGQVDHGN